MAYPLKILKEAQALFEMGESCAEVSKKVKIPRTAIVMRAKKEHWDNKKLTTIVAEKAEALTMLHNVQEKIDKIDEKAQALVKNKVDEILQLNNIVDNFIKDAVNLNMKNLRATLNEPDDFKRIIMANKMKATMPDLASIAGNRPSIKAPNDEDDEEKSEGIHFYLPDNGRGKK
jgi:hypothetical protein